MTALARIAADKQARTFSENRSSTLAPCHTLTPSRSCHRQALLDKEVKRKAAEGVAAEKAAAKIRKQERAAASKRYAELKKVYAAETAKSIAWAEESEGLAAAERWRDVDCVVNKLQSGDKRKGACLGILTALGVPLPAPPATPLKWALKADRLNALNYVRAAVLRVRVAQLPELRAKPPTPTPLPPPPPPPPEAVGVVQAGAAGAEGAEAEGAAAEAAAAAGEPGPGAAAAGEVGPGRAAATRGEDNDEPQRTAAGMTPTPGDDTGMTDVAEVGLEPTSPAIGEMEDDDDDEMEDGN